MKPYIVHLTPALLNNNNVPSNNLGDLIIYESTSKVLQDIFSQTDVINISTHDFMKESHFRLVKNASYTFIGGSNLLSSNIRIYNQWKYSTNRWHYLFPNIKNVSLLGVGWWQYQDSPTWRTAHFYKSILSKKDLLSVRDSYTEKQLRLCGIDNVINTSCPTTWMLNGFRTNKTTNANDCIFALTDYNPDNQADNTLIEILLSTYSKLYFFPQGLDDLNYIQTLPAFINNKSRFSVLNRDMASLRAFLSEHHSELNYIGTRLHLGIFCMQHNIPSLILSIDNRATEIAKDIHLATIQRTNFTLLKDWISNKFPENQIVLPMEAISKWKNQFMNESSR